MTYPHLFLVFDIPTTSTASYPPLLSASSSFAFHEGHVCRLRVPLQFCIYYVFGELELKKQIMVQWGLNGREGESAICWAVNGLRTF